MPLGRSCLRDFLSQEPRPSLVGGLAQALAWLTPRLAKKLRHHHFPPNCIVPANANGSSNGHRGSDSVRRRCGGGVAASFDFPVNGPMRPERWWVHADEGPFDVVVRLQPGRSGTRLGFVAKQADGMRMPGTGRLPGD